MTRDELIHSLKGIYRPSMVDRLLAIVFAVWAVGCLVILIQDARHIGGFDGFHAGFAFAAVLFALFMMDVNLRTVTVDDDTVSQRSPSGLYRQTFKHDDLSGMRVRGPRGGAAEVSYRGRWIFFCSNRNFRKRIKELTEQGGGHVR